MFHRVVNFVYITFECMMIVAMVQLVPGKNELSVSVSEQELEHVLNESDKKFPDTIRFPHYFQCTKHLS